MNFLARLAQHTAILLAVILLVIPWFPLSAFFNESHSPDELAPKPGRFLLAVRLRIYFRETGKEVHKME